MGHAYDGWVEIDAYGWRPPSDTFGGRRQLCTWIELEVLSAPMYGSCFGSGQIGQPIAIESIASITSPKRLRDTEVGGALASDVAQVELSVKRPRHKKTEGVQATVAQVSGRLQRELRQSKPFGYFYAKVRGVVPTRDITAIAYDAGGQVLGAAHGLRQGQIHQLQTIGRGAPAPHDLNDQRPPRQRAISD